MAAASQVARARRRALRAPRRLAWRRTITRLWWWILLEELHPTGKDRGDGIRPRRGEEAAKVPVTGGYIQETETRRLLLASGGRDEGHADRDPLEGERKKM